MLTNQKFNKAFIILAFSLLCSPILSFGQESGDGLITYLEKDGDSVSTLKTIRIYEPKGDIIQKVTINETWIKKGSIILIPKNTVVGFKNGTNDFKYTGHNEFIFNGLNQHRALKKESGGIWARIKRAIGSIIAYSPDGRHHLATIKTEFEVEIDSGNVKFKLIEGKVAIKSKTKVQMDDKELKKLGVLPEDSLSNNRRLLYTTKTTKYLNSNEEYLKSNKLNEKILTTDKDIDDFFKKQLRINRKLLKKAGDSSKLGFNMIENGLDSLGIIKYEKAINRGEITRGELIESSLIITEAYFRKEMLNERKAWFDLALHFTKIEDSISSAKFDYFNNLDKKSTAEVFLGDKVLSKEYLAWAYTVKLLINGCLETQLENPRHLLREARRLKAQLDNQSN